MDVAIIGAGHMGEACARLLARAGHRIVIVNSCGPELDDAAAKKTVAGLLRDMGLHPVDAGDLAGSTRQEPGSAVYDPPFTAAELRSGLAR